MPTLHSIIPFFIVENLQASLDFYQSKLGFEIEHKGGGNGECEDFWAMVRRDGVMVMLKAIAPEIHPQPTIRATNRRLGMPTSTPPTQTCCTKNTLAEPLRCANI